MRRNLSLLLYQRLPKKTCYHNFIRAKIYDYGPLSFDGGDCSKEICQILYNHLKHKDYGRILVKDFLYLESSGLCIDPCYKSKFRTKRKDAFDDFSEYLYSLPPIFIGTLTERNKIYIELSKKSKFS